MFKKVLVGLGLQKKMCAHCNERPAHEGHDYCTKTCGQLAKAKRENHNAPPRDNPRPPRGRGARAGGQSRHQPPKICRTCGYRPVFRDREFCSRSCSRGIPWEGPPSAPPYPRTHNRNQEGSHHRPVEPRTRRHSDFTPRDNRRKAPSRHDDESDEHSDEWDDDEELPDAPPSPPNRSQRTKGGRKIPEEVEEEEGDGSEGPFAPPARRPKQRPPSPPSPPPKSIPKAKPKPSNERIQVRDASTPPSVSSRQPKSQPRPASGLTAGAPWPPNQPTATQHKQPNNTQHKQQLSRFDEPYQSE